VDRRSLSAGSAGACFQFGDLGFQEGELLACPRQCFALHIKLIASNQVKPAQGTGQQGTQVLFHVLGRGGRNKGGNLGGQVVEQFGVEHGEGPVFDPMILACRPARSWRTESVPGVPRAVLDSASQYGDPLKLTINTLFY
jgi:hypothetical protein